MDGRCVTAAESVVALMDTTTRRSVQLTYETAEALHAIARPDCDWASGVASSPVLPR